MEEIEATAERIKKDKPNPIYLYEHVAKESTGFGESGTCTLCQGVINASDARERGLNCAICVHYIPLINTTYRDYFFPCLSDNAQETYQKVKNSITSEELLAGYRARADYIEKIISEYENGKTKGL